MIEPGQTRSQGGTEPHRIRTLARNPFALLLGLVGLFLIGASVFWVFGTGEVNTLNRYTAVIAVPSGLVVLLAAFRLRGASRLEPSTRKMWGLVALALASYCLGALLHVVALWQPDFWYLGPVSIGLELAAYPIAWIALILLPGPGRTRTDVLLMVLDVAIVAFSAAMLGWHLWLYPIARQADAGILATFWAALPPALDLATIFALAATVPRTRHQSTAVALWVLCFALAAALVGDWIAGVEMLRGDYRMGGVPGILYSGAWFGFAVAVYAQLRIPQRERAIRGPVRYSQGLSWIPYVALALAYFVPTLGSWNDKELLQQHLPATGLLMALVVARLAVTARENGRLGAAEREMLAQAVDQTMDAVVVTDRRSRVTYVNRAFTRITGYTPEQVVGHSHDRHGRRHRSMARRGGAGDAGPRRELGGPHGGPPER